MKPTEHNANAASTSKTGLLRAASRSCISGTLLTLAALAFTAAPALAAAPTVLSESTSPTAKPSEEVRLEATVNAGEEAAGETTECHFQYGETSVSEHSVACEQGTPPGTLEGGEQGVAVTVAGLQAGTTYDYRVVLKNASGIREGGEEKVTTLPVPATEVPSPIGSTTATFKGKLTPFNSTFPAEYYFSYIIGEEAFCLNEHETGRETASAEAVSTAVTELEPNQKYTVCLLSTNTLGDSEEDVTPKYFETKPAPPTVAPSGEPTSAVTPFEATLHAEANPDNQETTVYFQYSTSAAVSGSGALSTPTEIAPGTPGNSIGAGFGNVATEAATGHVLASNTTYYFQAVAINLTGTTYGTVEHFTTLAAEKPIVESESVSEVGATEAQLQAQVNPNYQATTYTFEYATEAALLGTPDATKVAGAPPATALTAGFGDQTAGPVDLGSTLQPSTVYYYRVLATNPSGTTEGTPATFTTFPPSASALPDDRAYELVSKFPAGTGEEAYVPATGSEYMEGEEHGIHTELIFDVAANGEAVVYPGDPPPTGGNGSRGKANGNEHLATRGAGAGWTQVDLQPPGTPSGTRYQAFSTELSAGILESTENVLGGGTGAYRDIYATAITGGAGGQYAPFYTDSPPNRTANEFDLYYAGSNVGTSVVPAFSHHLFEANDALPTSNVPAAGGSGEDPVSHIRFAQEKNLYDSVGGILYLVNVLPDGKTEPNASFGQYPNYTASLVEDNSSGSNLISADGSRIFWTAQEGPPGLGRAPKALYVRENDTQPQSPIEGRECTVPADACTLQLDAALPGATGSGGGGRFWAASSDGSKAFFTDESKLTSDSTAEVGEPDLYEYEVNDETGKPGALTDLTVDGHAGEHADVRGVVGSSEDGEYVYFVATGLLSGENGEHHSPTPGQDNLYLRHDHATTFIAALSAEDGDDVAPLTEVCDEGNAVGGCVGDWEAAAGVRTAEVTPDGHSLVFMSNQPLTGYDNAAQTSVNGPLDEVFLYEASSNALRCLSCNPSGEPPVPTEFNTHHDGNPIGGFIPVSRSVAGEQPRVISEDGGRVFFDSGEPLLPTDTNGWLDVYEWERDGEGTCTEARGCIYDLSGGTDPENSYLLGTDASGDNAFFISRAQLVPADRGSEGDVVYDARVDGVQPPATEACEGTACQGVPPTPPIFATPASATITGGDDVPPVVPAKPAVKQKTAAELRVEKLAKALKACRRDKQKAKRKGCEASAEKKYGAVKAKKSAKKSAHTDRRSRR